ncbi:glycosyltransferase family 4 protein [Methanosarcina sp. Mfa9]|uniref:glycosyltransferase family 4 protein n=1 Tax=Methanosarcina sp. Mfa9 TaxID=3439063 RepID=UPI003F82738D
MKIAVLINTLYSGRGMDYVAEQQARELITSGHDVTVFTFDDDDHCSGEIHIQRLGWPKNPLINYSYRLLFPLDIFKIKKYLRCLQTYDLIIAHFYPMTYLAYRSKKENPNLYYIYYNHGIVNSSFQSPSHHIYAKLLSFLSSVSISNVDAVISISHFIKKQLSLKSAMKQVIYNKVDPERFAYQCTDIDSHLLSLMDKWEIAPKFLYVGTLSQGKGIELLIKAFRRVTDTYPNAKLLLVGTPTHGFSLSNYIPNNDLNDSIYHLGPLDSHTLGYMYQTCDVCVSASTWESFNLPLVEAQLLGKPVVAYNTGAHGEVVKDQETGVLVESFDTDKFAEAMIQVYKMREIMGRNAKIWAYQFSTQNLDALKISKVIEAWYKP